MPRTVAGMLALMALLMHIAGCATQQQSGQQNVRAEIEAANARLLTALAAGDAAGMAAAYADNAALLPAHSDFVTGRPAIEKFWTGAISAGVKRAVFITLETEGHGDTAHEVGRYTMYGADGKVLDTGKYVVIWKREQNAWRIYRDIWTTTLPAVTT